MVSHPSESAAPITAAMRTAILQELGGIAASIANRQIDVFATRLADALLACPAELCASLEEANCCIDAAQLLKKNRYPFYYAVSERLAETLRLELDEFEGQSATPSDTGGTGKALPPDVEIDRKLCLLKAARAIEGEHAERLMALNIRLAHLLGRETLDTAQNPFRPQVFLSAIHDGWCAFYSDTAAHHLVFRLLGPDLCVDIGPILEAQNAALIKRGILPTLTPAQPIESADAVMDAAQQQMPPLHDGDTLAQQLRRLFPADEDASAKRRDRPLTGALPALFADEKLQAVVSRDQLLGYLSQVQRNGPDPQQAVGEHAASLLAHVRQWAPAGTLAPVDAHTIDLLLAIFEAVFGNANIPAEIRTLIGSLQIPLLKATLADKDFFFRPEHPARRIIELLAQLGVDWDSRKGPNDPLYQTILRNVKRIQSDQRAPSFSDALADIETFIASDEAAFVPGLATTISHALQQEKRQQAVKTARHEVALRLGTGEVAAFVETFLEDRWVSVLALAYIMQEEKPQVVESVVSTMDDLCWSVKPKITPNERKVLLAKLPSIVVRLNRWLDLIQWNDAERVKFFDDLAKCHASIVRAPLDLSPERQVQIALSVAKKAAERRLRRQARQQPEPVPDQFTRMVDKLECGTWMEFAREDGTLKVRLAWTSPMRSLFIFSTRQRQEALSMSADELAQALRESRARVVLMAGLVTHALTQAVGADSADGAAQSAA